MTSWIALALMVFAQLAGAMSTGAQTSSRRALFFDAIPFRDDAGTGSRLDLILAVPSALVAFERDEDLFTASYRVRIEIDSAARRVYDTTLEHRATTRSADVASGSVPTYDFFQHRVAVPPGSYAVRVEIIDARAAVAALARRSVTVDEVTPEEFGLSGLMLVDRVREETSGFVITPRLSDAVESDGTGYFLFFEAYNGADTLPVRFDVVYARADDALDDADRIPGSSSDRTLPPGRSQQWVRVDATGLARGSYRLELIARSAADTSRILASARREIRVGAGAAGLPAGDEELEQRISQLRHVALPSEVDRIREGSTPSEKRTRYAEFWKQRDPTPGTVENEAMQEYFSRIDYANEHFGNYSAGWMTDRGRVYVLFGAPDNIERDPFRSDAGRLETWQYFSRGNLRITFEDASGFGDYRLVTPISPLEKYRYGG